MTPSLGRAQGPHDPSPGTLPGPESRLDAGAACPARVGLLKSAEAVEDGGVGGWGLLRVSILPTLGPWKLTLEPSESYSRKGSEGPALLPPTAAPRGSPVVTPPTHLAEVRAWLPASAQAPREGCVAHQGL